MEDDLKILKVEYLSNHSSDPPQILNLSSVDQTKILEMKTISNGVDLKILKVEYLSNHSSDSPWILNLSLWDQAEMINAWNDDDLQ